jgi:peptidoglycan/LPS O-acetylase OafA/YrhL
MFKGIYSRLRRITSDHSYFPEIDGIRFLAIGMVILYHAFNYLDSMAGSLPEIARDDYYWFRIFLLNGDRGVELFFVLSGFILCLPFAKQYINGGKKVELKRYYLRRLTRLEPPYIIAITALFLLQLAMHIHPASELVPSWLASLIYAHYLILRHIPLLTVVAWSLEIEIQFYLLAPILFRILKLPIVWRRTLLIIAIAGTVTLQHLFPAPSDLLTLYSYIQYFLTGILLADFYVSRTAEGFFSRSFVPIISLICLVAIIYMPILNKLYYKEGPDVFLARVMFPYTIGLFYYTILKNEAVKSVFSFRFIPIIGGMCYSIYLVHYPIISFLGGYTRKISFTGYYIPDVLLHLTLLTIPVLLLSSVFYFYIERPFMAGKWTDMLMRKFRKRNVPQA